MFYNFLIQEAQNSQLQSKYKKAVAELDESEERSEAAEQALQKARARARGASQAATRGVSAVTITRHLCHIK